MVERLGAIAGVLVVAAAVTAAAQSDQPRNGILEPVGGGVTVVYHLNRVAQ